MFRGISILEGVAKLSYMCVSNGIILEYVIFESQSNKILLIVRFDGRMVESCGRLEEADVDVDVDFDFDFDVDADADANIVAPLFAVAFVAVLANLANIRSMIIFNLTI